MSASVATIVNVAHAYPLRHVPRGGRLPRFEWVQARTPVRLREAAPSDFVRAVTLRSEQGEAQMRLYGFEGRLWRLVQHVQPASDYGLYRGRRDWLREIPIPPAEVIAYLEDGTTPNQYRGYIRSLGPVESLHEAFALTPVLPRSGQNHAGRGRDRQAILSRQVLHDGRAEAVRALHAFFEEGVVIAGDDVFVRSGTPFIASTRQSSEGWFACPVTGEGTRTMRLYNLDRAEEAFETERALPHAFVRERPNVGRFDIHDASFFGLDDIRLQANLFVDTVAGIGRSLYALRPAEREAVLDCRETDLRRRLEAILPWHLRATVGGIGLAQAPEAMAACAEVLRGLRSAQEVHRVLWVASDPHWLGLYFDTLVKFEAHDLPRLQAAGHVGASQDDDEAMARL